MDPLIRLRAIADHLFERAQLRDRDLTLHHYLAALAMLRQVATELEEDMDHVRTH